MLLCGPNNTPMCCQQQHRSTPASFSQPASIPNLSCSQAYSMNGVCSPQGCSLLVSTNLILLGNNKIQVMLEQMLLRVCAVDQYLQRSSRLLSCSQLGLCLHSLQYCE